MKNVKYVLAAIVLLSVIGIASAVETNYGTVADYLKGSDNTFTIGGITFGEFSATGISGGGAHAVVAEEIAISGQMLADDVVSIYFNSGWTANSGEWTDTTIDFVALSDIAIQSNLLMLDAYGSSNGATISVTENVKDAKLTEIADKQVVWFSGTPENKVTMDTATYPAGTTGVWIHKDVYVSGGNETGGFGHISKFSQNFIVPEPMTLALLALGGLVLRRKR